MKHPSSLADLTRTGLAAIAALALVSTASAQAPPPYEATPALVAAAVKEGKVVFYASTDVLVSEKVASAFEAKYPGIKVQVERAGAERIFQRINQEYSRKIYLADVIETSDAVHFTYFKRMNWLQSAVPSEVAKYWPAAEKDVDGQYAVYRAHLSVIAYNTKLVKKEDAPKSHADLLDPKWSGKMIKAHPGYSGTILTGSYVLSELLGWPYFQKLGQQKIMQTQSSTEPPKKLAQGERQVMADGNEYNVFILKESGVGIEPVYATEGSPLIVGNAALLKNAANPNAGKLFYNFLFSAEAQQIGVTVGGLRSFHPNVKEPSSRTPLSQIKLLQADPALMEKQIPNIKKKYEEYFGT